MPWQFDNQGKKMLIQEIRARPEIWDPNLRKVSSKKSADAWLAVGRAFGITSKSDLSNIRHQWHSIRCRYVTRNGPNAELRAELTFLDPIIGIARPRHVPTTGEPMTHGRQSLPAARRSPPPSPHLDRRLSVPGIVGMRLIKRCSSQLQVDEAPAVPVASAQDDGFVDDFVLPPQLTACSPSDGTPPASSSSSSSSLSSLSPPPADQNSSLESSNGAATDSASSLLTYLMQNSEKQFHQSHILQSLPLPPTHSDNSPEDDEQMDQAVHSPDKITTSIVRSKPVPLQPSNFLRLRPPKQEVIIIEDNDVVEEPDVPVTIQQLEEIFAKHRISIMMRDGTLVFKQKGADAPQMPRLHFVSECMLRLSVEGEMGEVRVKGARRASQVAVCSDPADRRNLAISLRTPL